MCSTGTLFGAYGFPSMLIMNVFKVFIIWLPIFVMGSKDNEMKIIADVLKNFDKPSNVIANLCWRPMLKKQLLLYLNDAANPISVKFTDFIDKRDISEKNVFLVDLTCPEVTEFLQLVNSNNLFQKPLRWFILTMLTYESVPKELNDLHILPDSEVYITKCNQNDSCNINLVYKVRPHLEWIEENYGNWTADHGLVRSSHVMETTLPMRRKNLARETITTSVVITDNNTLNNLDDFSHADIDSISKSGYHQLTPLYDFINATRNMIYTDTWGYYINGSWTGILGHIAQGKAELSGSVMFITKERMQVVEYLTHPTATSVRFIFREPPLSYQNNLYLLPFRASVWYCIGSFVVIMVAIMYANAYWEERKFKDEEDQSTSMLIPNVSDVAVVVMSAITQQGSTVELKGTLGRFVIFILFLIFLFLYTAYSASIVVLLQSSSDQIRTLSDLLQSKLELGVEDTPFNRYLFAIQKEPIRKAIYEEKIAPKGSKPKFYNLDDGILHLQKRPFAFHCTQGLAYKAIEKYFYEHEKCGLHEIAYLQDISPWLSCSKESPFKEIFKIGLLRNVETGLNERTNRLIYSRRPACSARGGSFVSVALVDCWPVLLLLLYGVTLAVVVLLAEVMHHRRSARNTGK